jgi:uncharacterized DUF497 family protein
MPIAGVEWDEKKARDNVLNHRIRFETAQYALFDKARLERADRSESNVSEEERVQVLGKAAGVILFAVYEDKKTVKRLITARVALKPERRLYNGYHQIDGNGWTAAE